MTDKQTDKEARQARVNLDLLIPYLRARLAAGTPGTVPAPTKESIKMRKLLAQAEKHAEKLKARQARYRAAHAEKVKAWQARYRAAHAEKLKAKYARYRAANAEKVKAWQARYYAEHAEKLKEKAKARYARWRAKNPKKLL